ncbi:hypothetical protein P9D26_04540 [Bacillus velezensis]|uniref:hypothetical protein n=1 Tax=Bacillus velezensis TaxID=492670 RepID=UPI002DBAB81D|nr:hypothetical protein [Bacillus velezensis]MEC1392610.1 hypothetical protein [Bacillus velezensis]
MVTYQSIFNEILGDSIRDIHIIGYDYSKENVNKNHNYTPYYHSLDDNSSFLLGSFLRKHIVFSSYSEKEIINKYNKGQFDQLEKLVQITKRNRLPKREGSTNGLYSEVLLDLILNLKYPDIYKACVRTLHRQRTDNQEIKGFDSTHLLIQETKLEQIVYLILGQAKLGSKSYCLGSIKEDINKTTFFYTYDELFFISDKVSALEEPVQNILNDLNEFFFDIESDDDLIKKEKVNKYFSENNIKLTIPCLIAYDKPSVYQSKDMVIANLEREIDSVIKNLDSCNSEENGLNLTIIFILFPIKEIKKLREGMDHEL